MELNTLWFVLIAVLYTGYFVLEGFDFGVGILLPFLGRSDTQRRMIINTVGPHWDGNEVWLITAGGATFAAFPHWYATLFSGFYLPLFIILIALIFRGVAFEFRSKDDHPLWRSFWDWGIFFGSLIPAFLWGVAFANLIRGVPIDADMNYVGGFWNLLNPYALLGGLVSLSGFVLHGDIFLTLKTSGKLYDHARNMAIRIWLPTILIFSAFTIFTYFETDVLFKLGIDPGVIPIAAILCGLVTGLFLWKKRDGWAFLMNTLTIICASTTIFLILFPRVMISSLDPAWSLTIQNSASAPYTLKVMTIVAAIFVPIVLIYQSWTYWVFRKRILERMEDLHY